MVISNMVAVEQVHLDMVEVEEEDLLLVLLELILLWLEEVAEMRITLTVDLVVV